VNSFNTNLLNESALKEDEGKEGDNFEEMIPVLKSLPKLTYDTFGKAYEAVLNITSSPDAKTMESLRQLTFKYGIACEDLLEICKYKDEEISCCDYFLPLYTEHGFCYSFNTRYYGTPEEE
jgi:acid-sensing ion channel, other